MKLKHIVVCCHHCCDKYEIDADELMAIKERLKKRIEENTKWLVKNEKHGSDLHDWYRQRWLENAELQKILGDVKNPKVLPEGS